MPLYGGPRDRALIRRINNEILQRIVGTEVAVYKLAVSEMESNIYGESSEKRYYNPVRVHALTRRDDTTMTLNELGELDSQKTLSIGFLRDELVNLNLIIEISDIILWDDGYYQVDNVRTTSHWWGRNPDTSIGIAEGDVSDHGYTVSVIAEVHRTSIANLNLVETRSGNNNITTKSNLPKDI